MTNDPMKSKLNNEPHEKPHAAPVQMKKASGEYELIAKPVDAIKLVPELKTAQPMKLEAEAEPLSLSPEKRPEPLVTIQPPTGKVEVPVAPTVASAPKTPVRPVAAPNKTVVEPRLPLKPKAVKNPADDKRERIAKVENMLRSFRLKFDKNTNTPRHNKFVADGETPPVKKKMSLMGLGAVIFGSGALFSVSPMIVGIVLSPIFCGAGANEGNCGLAALPWFMFFTIPVGAIVLLSGLIVGLTGLVKFMVDSYRKPTGN